MIQNVAGCCRYSSASTCNHRGTVKANRVYPSGAMIVSDGSCTCPASTVGAGCYSNMITCSGGGVALANGTCLCDRAFSGKDCSERIKSTASNSAMLQSTATAAASTQFRTVAQAGKHARCASCHCWWGFTACTATTRFGSGLRHAE